MRRVLSLAVLVALSLAPACYCTIEADGYIWACDDRIPLGNGQFASGCYRTTMRVLR
jgi:hypothetical protein